MADETYESKKLHSQGTWSAGTEYEVQAGQGVVFLVENLNALGTTIRITSAKTSDTEGSVILPHSTASYRFDCFGVEPLHWKFDVQTDSDVFLVGWKLFSTWIPGDPLNP